MQKNKCTVPDGQIYWSIQNEMAPGIPVMVVHGGPGNSHNYLLPLTDLLPAHPIIYYDQLDCGLSDKINDPKLWAIPRFVNEIECLRKHLGLEQFILFGHSFGTIFALDYALKYNQYLKGLILASPLISIEIYSRHMKKILSTYPERIQTIFINANRFPESACRLALMEANLYYASLQICRLDLWPELLLESSLNTNIELRDHMWGKIDFFITGDARHYERRHLLPSLEVKTLLCCGEFDLIDEGDCRKFAADIPDAVVSIIAGASHNPQFEAPEEYGHVLNQFIDGLNFE